jgi:hypothetical protein
VIERNFVYTCLTPSKGPNSDTVRKRDERETKETDRNTTKEQLHAGLSRVDDRCGSQGDQCIAGCVLTGDSAARTRDRLI